MTDYAGIIERLEKATGPNFQLECDIKNATGDEFLRVPTYTASIDEAVALVERMLPGAYIDVSGDTQNSQWECNVVPPCLATGIGLASSGPIAILLALFRALEARGTGE